MLRPLAFDERSDVLDPIEVIDVGFVGFDFDLDTPASRKLISPIVASESRTPLDRRGVSSRRFAGDSPGKYLFRMKSRILSAICVTGRSSPDANVDGRRAIMRAPAALR